MSFQQLSAHGIEGAIWMAFFNALPPYLQDIHWHPAYARAQERSGERAVLRVFRDHDRFIMQAFMDREVTDGWTDRSNLYAFGGPVGKSVSPHLIETFQEYLGVGVSPQFRIASEFSTLHPLHVDHQIPLVNAETTYIKDVVVMDLSPQPEEILAACSRHTRRSIAKARARAAWVVRERMHASTVEMFLDLYVKSLARLGASARWERMIDHVWGYVRSTDLVGRVHIFTANLVGAHRALLVLHWGGTAYAVFLGSNGKHPDLGLDDLLYFDAALELRTCGVHRFVLGGGLTSSPDDTLLAFKSGLGKIRAPLRSYFRVGNESAYNGLAQATRDNEIAQHGRESTSTFLPIYRRDFV